MVITPCRHLFCCLFLIFILILSAQSLAKPATNFKQFVQHIRQEALAQGISKTIVQRYLKRVYPITSSRQRLQEEVTPPSFTQFRKRTWHNVPLPLAYQMYQKHLKLLKKVSQRYPVQPSIIIALWGNETGFGNDIGHYNTINTLATLAYYGRKRASYFKQQLFDFLHILNQSHPIIKQQLLSTFDGGMGQVQFEPSNYFKYAVDFDNNGFRDIWTSHADVFASFANYLVKHNWNHQQTWGLAVKVPHTVRIKNLAKQGLKRSLGYWRSLGVTQKNGAALPLQHIQAYLLLPDGINGPAFLAYPNFDVLLKWNGSVNEALMTGLIADAIQNRAKKANP